MHCSNGTGGAVRTHDPDCFFSSVWQAEVRKGPQPHGAQSITQSHWLFVEAAPLAGYRWAGPLTHFGTRGDCDADFC